MIYFDYHRYCKHCGHRFDINVTSSDLRQVIDSAFEFKQKFAAHETECKQKLVEKITFGGCYENRL